MKKRVLIIIVIIINATMLYSQADELNKLDNSSDITETPITQTEQNITEEQKTPAKKEKTKKTNPPPAKSRPAVTKTNKKEAVPPVQNIVHDVSSDNSSDNIAIITVVDPTGDIIKEEIIVTKNDLSNDEVVIHPSPINEADFKNIDVRITPVVTEEIMIVRDDKSSTIKDFGDPRDYFVTDIKLKQITKNETQLQIFDRSNKNTLGFFSIMRETATKNSFNNTILTDVYYVSDHALEPIAGRASQREVGFLSVYYNKYMASLGGTISTSIIDFLVLGGGAALVATAFILCDQNTEGGLGSDPIGTLANSSNSQLYLPLFIGGIAAMSYAVIFSAVVIVNAVFTARYYSSYKFIKNNIIRALNYARNPITIKDADGDPIVKIGFDLRISPPNFQ